MQDNQYSEKLKLSELQVFNPIIRSWAVQGFRINLVGTIFRKICMSSTFNQVFSMQTWWITFFALVFWNSETFNIHCCLVSGGPSSRVGWRYSLTFLLLSWTVLLFVDLYDLLRLVSGGWVFNLAFRGYGQPGIGWKLKSGVWYCHYEKTMKCFVSFKCQLRWHSLVILWLPAKVLLLVEPRTELFLTYAKIQK